MVPHLSAIVARSVPAVRFRSIRFQMPRFRSDVDFFDQKRSAEKSDTLKKMRARTCERRGGKLDVRRTIQRLKGDLAFCVNVVEIRNFACDAKQTCNGNRARCHGPIPPMTW